MLFFTAFCKPYNQKNGILTPFGPQKGMQMLIFGEW